MFPLFEKDIENVILLDGFQTFGDEFSIPVQLLRLDFRSRERIGKIIRPNR